jgi:hypothetical protein
LKRIIAPLRENEEGLSDKQLASLKAFCLALHRAIATQIVPPFSDREPAFDDEFGLTR